MHIEETAIPNWILLPKPVSPENTVAEKHIPLVGLPDLVPTHPRVTVLPSRPLVKCF